MFGKRKLKEDDIEKKELLMSEKNVLALGEQFLLDTKTDITKVRCEKMPLEKMASLGASVSSIMPLFQSLNQSKTETGKLYRLVNNSFGDKLKPSGDGTFWGALKKNNGGSKMAKFQEVPSLGVDPTTMLVAVVLYSFEQQIGKIYEMEQQILSFLENEKESQIEADIISLNSTMKEYTVNWDKELFVQGHYQKTLIIKRNAEKNIISYQKDISKLIQSEDFLVMDVDTKIDNLKKQFTYYRMSLYIYSLASLMEIMMLGDFREENILRVKEEIENRSAEYRDIFTKSSAYIETMEEKEVSSNIMKGLATVSQAVGSFIGGIPFVKEGPVDEWLIENGESIHHNIEMEKEKKLSILSYMSNPGTQLFSEKLKDINDIYNHTTGICVDDKNLYLMLE